MQLRWEKRSSTLEMMRHVPLEHHIGWGCDNEAQPLNEVIYVSPQPHPHEAECVVSILPVILVFCLNTCLHDLKLPKSVVS